MKLRCGLKAESGGVRGDNSPPSFLSLHQAIDNQSIAGLISITGIHTVKFSSGMAGD